MCSNRRFTDLTSLTSHYITIATSPPRKFDVLYTMYVQTVLPISHLLHLMYITIATSYGPSTYGPSTYGPSTYEPTDKPTHKRKLDDTYIVCSNRRFTDLTSRTSYVHHHHNSNQETQPGNQET